MSHLYPLAEDHDVALSGTTPAARTRYEAERLANGLAVIALQTEWVAVSEEEIDSIFATAEAGPGEGFVQRYENADGTPVLAVTYWKLGAPLVKSASKPALPPSQIPIEQDHTDDLYFRQGRTRKGRRKKGKPDPNQMDLFGDEPKSD